MAFILTKWSIIQAMLEFYDLDVSVHVCTCRMVRALHICHVEGLLGEGGCVEKQGVGFGLLLASQVIAPALWGNPGTTMLLTRCPGSP